MCKVFIVNGPFVGFRSEPIAKQERDEPIQPPSTKNFSPDHDLAFDTPIILIGAASVNEPVLRSLLALGYPVIAADGGANNLRSLDITPKVIIGDMDSLEDRAFWEARTTLVTVDEQETTDFEKCIYSTCSDIHYCFGFLGGRFDHSLATMHVLTKYADRNICLIGDEELIFAARGSLKLDMRPGDRISLYPLTQVVFEGSSGLAYPLDGLKMEQGSSIGTSNAATDDLVMINAESGTYAVMLDHGKLPLFMELVGQIG